MRGIGRRFPPYVMALIVVALTLVAVQALVGALYGTPLLAISGLAYMLAFPAVGAFRWLRSGHGLLATLSWTVPMAVVLVALLYVSIRGPLREVAVVLTLLAALLMIGIPEAGEWWYIHVLRMTPPDKWRR